MRTLPYILRAAPCTCHVSMHHPCHEPAHTTSATTTRRAPHSVSRWSARRRTCVFWLSSRLAHGAEGSEAIRTRVFAAGASCNSLIHSHAHLHAWAASCMVCLPACLPALDVCVVTTPGRFLHGVPACLPACSGCMCSHNPWTLPAWCACLPACLLWMYVYAQPLDAVT
jgi:hypothetical protein